MFHPNYKSFKLKLSHPLLCISSYMPFYFEKSAHNLFGRRLCLSQLKFNEPDFPFDLLFFTLHQMAFVESFSCLLLALKTNAGNFQAKLSSWDNSGVAWVVIKHNPASQWVNTESAKTDHV